MIAGIALITGFFLVPAGLLVIGHRFRGRPARRRRVFWGATIGYLAGVVVASAAMMLPPVLWTNSPALRAAAVFWAMPAGALLGFVAGLLRAGTEGER